MKNEFTQSQALTQALILSVTAPSDAQARQALDLAGRFTRGLSHREVAACQRAAEIALGTDRASRRERRRAQGCHGAKRRGFPGPFTSRENDNPPPGLN